MVLAVFLTAEGGYFINQGSEHIGEAYPEIQAQRELIIKVIKEEEDAFLRTLENGIRLLDDAAKAAKAENRTAVS